MHAGGPGGHHQRAGRGADQDQPPAAAALEGGEVLGQAAAPGDAEYVGRLVAERGEQVRDQAAQAGEAVGATRQG